MTSVLDIKNVLIEILERRCCCDYKISSSRRLSPCGNSRSGAIAIPFGDPQFFDRAIALEFSFITLAIVILLDVRLTVNRVPLAKLALCTCIPLAILVMVGNSLAPPHVELMTTFSKPFNAMLADNRWLCLAGSTYWHNHPPVCKAASHFSKSKGLDGSAVDSSDCFALQSSCFLNLMFL